MVEPDEGAALTLVSLLEDHGYRVARSRDAHAAYELARAEPPDLIIMDLILPDRDGLTLYVDLKLMTGASVIVCSATKRLRDRPLGFKLGVDDFVPKPFDWEDVEGRIESALRRTPGQLPGPPALPHVKGAEAPAQHHRPDPAPSVERARDRTLVGGKSLALTPTEHRLLSSLLSSPDEFVPRDELARSVWGYDDPGIADAIHVHMHRLRSKLASADWRGGAAPQIKSSRGRGYAICRPMVNQGLVVESEVMDHAS